MSVVSDFLKTIDKRGISVDADTAIGLDSRNVRFIDIREDQELEDGIIAGAIVIRRGRLEMEFEALGLASGQRAIIYCASGVRSALAASSLRAIGFDQAFTLSGGISAWRERRGAVAAYRPLTGPERLRYSRQIKLPEIGESGQSRLRDAKILIVGAGGLGSPSAFYLAAAGVGTIEIVDHDVVELSNLHRQILHRTEALGRPKAESACDALRALNPDIRVIPHQVRLDAANAHQLLSSVDLVIDGSDNLATRALLNKISVGLGKPIVYGAVEQFRGQVSVFGLSGGPCYRCLYPEDPPSALTPNCAEAGVLGVLPGIIGVMQAGEAIKILLGIGQSLSGRMLSIDLASGVTRNFQFKRRIDCSCCGGGVHRESATTATAPNRSHTSNDLGVALSA